MRIQPTDDRGWLRCVQVDPETGQQCFLLMKDHAGVEHDYENPIGRLLDHVIVAAVVATFISPNRNAAAVIDSLGRNLQAAIEIALGRKPDPQ
jgi:hypothetical protein